MQHAAAAALDQYCQFTASYCTNNSHLYSSRTQPDSECNPLPSLVTPTLTAGKVEWKELIHMAKVMTKWNIAYTVLSSRYKQSKAKTWKVSLSAAIYFSKALMPWSFQEVLSRGWPLYTVCKVMKTISKTAYPPSWAYKISNVNSYWTTIWRNEIVSLMTDHLKTCKSQLSMVKTLVSKMCMWVGLHRKQVEPLRPQL